MNKLTLPIAFIALCFLSCEKNTKTEDNPQPQKLRQITLNIAGMAGGDTGAASPDSLRKHISHLYMSFVDGGTFQTVTVLHQTADDPNFGRLTTNIPGGGTFWVGVIGSRGPIDFAESGSLSGVLNAGSGDTFVKYLNLDVNGTIQPVKLVRVVSKIRFNFTAKAPANEPGLREPRAC